MGSQRNIFPPAIFLNLGLVLIATLFLIAYSSAYAVPLSSRADDGGDGDDERIQILRRSGAAEENGGMEDALKYLEELDKYYAQVARPRFGKRSDLSLNKMAKLLRTSVPVEMIYRGL